LFCSKGKVFNKGNVKIKFILWNHRLRLLASNGVYINSQRRICEVEEFFLMVSSSLLGKDSNTWATPQPLSYFSDRVLCFLPKG
jgi:hypothetical protein